MSSFLKGSCRGMVRIEVRWESSKDRVVRINCFLELLVRGVGVDEYG